MQESRPTAEAPGTVARGGDLAKCKSCQQSHPISSFNGLKTCPQCLRQSKRKRDQARHDKMEAERRTAELTAVLEETSAIAKELSLENARLRKAMDALPSDLVKMEPKALKRPGSESSGGSRVASSHSRGGAPAEPP